MWPTFLLARTARMGVCVAILYYDIDTAIEADDQSGPDDWVMTSHFLHLT